MSMERLNDLYHRRGVAITAARALLDRASSDGNRTLTTEEATQCDALMDESDRLDKDAKRIERVMDEERQQGEIKKPIVGRGASDPKSETAKEYLSHGRTLILEGVPSSTQEARKGMRSFIRSGLQAMNDGERRALQADSDTAGGFVRPDQDFVARLIMKVDDQVHVRRQATIIPVTTAESLGVPSLDADPADADWTVELAVGGEDSSMGFGKRELRPQPLAKLLKVSNKLLRSAAIDIEGLIRDRLAYKIAIPQEKGYLTGSGSNEPLGVFTASNDGISTGRDVLTGSATDFTPDGLLEAKYTMKAQYWPRARWMFHRTGVRRIRQLKEATTNAYIWQPGLQRGQPDMLLDSPIDVSEYCPNTFTASLYVGLLADWSYYWIAEALTFQLQRLVELYATTNQTGFIVRAEVDGMPTLEEAFVRLKTSAS